MAIEHLYLADKSALARMGVESVGQRLGPLLVDGLIATCPIIDHEVLCSARSWVDHELARSGHHRLPIPDLLVAAVAELNGVSVLHYDADFDQISAVTHQETIWVAPRGSLRSQEMRRA